MSDEAVTIRMGKNGLTSALVDEVRSVLRKRKLVKVKMLKSSLGESDKHALAEGLRASTKAKRASMIGHTVTLEM